MHRGSVSTITCFVFSITMFCIPIQRLSNVNFVLEIFYFYLYMIRKIQTQAKTVFELDLNYLQYLVKHLLSQLKTNLYLHFLFISKNSSPEGLYIIYQLDR